MSFGCMPETYLPLNKEMLQSFIEEARTWNISQERFDNLVKIWTKGLARNTFNAGDLRFSWDILK
jgi:hypothetical protein